MTWVNYFMINRTPAERARKRLATDGYGVAFSIVGGKYQINNATAAASKQQRSTRDQKTSLVMSVELRFGN